METRSIAALLNDRNADFDNYENYLSDMGFTVYALSHVENFIEIDVCDINSDELIGSIYYYNGRWFY